MIQNKNPFQNQINALVIYKKPFNSIVLYKKPIKNEFHSILNRLSFNQIYSISTNPFFPTTFSRHQIILILNNLFVSNHHFFEPKTIFQYSYLFHNTYFNKIKKIENTFKSTNHLFQSLKRISKINLNLLNFEILNQSRYNIQMYKFIYIIHVKFFFSFSSIIIKWIFDLLKIIFNDFFTSEASTSINISLIFRYISNKIQTSLIEGIIRPNIEFTFQTSFEHFSTPFIKMFMELSDKYDIIYIEELYFIIHPRNFNVVKYNLRKKI